jgi:hypothetical protein
MTTGIMANNTFPFYMQDFFDNMKQTINDHTTQKNVSSSPYELPYFMVYENCNNTNQPYFDSITVDTGTIALDIWLEGAAPGFTVDITGVSFGSYTKNQSVQITSSPSQVIITIDGAVIDKNNPPKFTLNGISPSSGYTLVMKPQILDITLRKATGLKVGEMEKPVPDAIVNNIKMDPIPDMFNAKIVEGAFKITAEPPSNGNNLIIAPEVTIQQDPVVISGNSFNGLGVKTFNQGVNSLNNALISGSELTVTAGTIMIKADPVNGSAFNLTGGMLPIKLNMGMNIDKLDEVRWKSDILPSIDIPEVDFSNMGGQSGSFINWIQFGEIKLNVNFTSGLPKELKNKIALSIDCPSLGFNHSTQTLGDGNNPFTGGHEKLAINANATVAFDVKLIPVIDGTPTANSPYIEVGPVTIGNGDITMNIDAQVSVEVDWESAEINLDEALEALGEIKGTFPEDGDEVIDLSEFGGYMKDITFSDSLKAKIFLSGMPGEIVKKVEPTLHFDAEWENDNSVEMIDQTLVVGKELPLLPGKNPSGEWVYTGTALPQGDGLALTGLNDIIAAFPRNLRFNYEMKLKKGPITVSRQEFENAAGDGKIKALLVLLLPLELTAKEDGYFTIPDLFESDKDLFGRTNPQDSSLFTGINIKSLGIRIDFGYPLFNGACLHFDKGNEEGKKLFGDNGFPLGSGNSLNIIFTGDQQRFIEENLIIPDVRFKFPQGGTIRIGRNPLPVRMVIAASGSYTLDLDDLLK